MEEQERPSTPPPQTLTLTKHDEFLRSLSRIAVSQVCETRGFHSIHRSALDALSDLAIRYAFQASKQGVRYAELSGRRDPNVFDLIKGIEELGFSGSGVGEIGRFVGSEAEVPFVGPVVRVPFSKECRLGLSFGVVGDERRGDHVPSWLPVFPDERTYINVKENGDRIEEKEMKVELLPMMVQGQVGTSDKVNVLGGASKVRRVDEVNPFLAPPFSYGEKEISDVVILSKVSQEGFVINGSAFGDSEVQKGGKVGLDEKEDDASEKRPRVQFKLSSCSTRRCVGMPVTDDVQGFTVYFGGEDEKDTDKRLAKVIVKESADTPPEPAPL